LRRAVELDPEAARPLAAAYIAGNLGKIRASWAYAPHRAEITRAGETTAGNAFMTGCVMFGILAAGIVLIGALGGSALGGSWWLGALAAATLAGIGVWLQARHNRRKSAEMLQTLTPGERAIVEGGATPAEMLDALERWNAVELDRLRRAAEAAARDRATVQTLTATTTAINSVNRTLDAINRPTRSRRRRSRPW
jgi:hypothetical protein